jgi:hypothetical protein
MANEPDETAERALGSDGHVRETLGRAREAIRASRERTAQSRSVLARAESLIDASEPAVRESHALRAQLQTSVTAYVRRLRADGLPSERMLVQVKSVVRDATPPELDVDEARELMEDVVRWSVEAYYDGG